MDSRAGRGKRVWMAALIAALVAAAPAAAAGTSDDSGSKGSSLDVPDQGLATRDVRSAVQRDPAVPVTAAAASEQAKIRTSLGRQGILDVDPVTGTPRVVAKLNGFPPGRANPPPKAVPLAYPPPPAPPSGSTRVTSLPCD